MKEVKKIFVIASEASGDMLGAKLLEEINKNNNYNYELTGVGGQLMQAQNFTSIFPLEDLAVMGFVEVIAVLPRIISRINFTYQKILEFKPDIIITIDSPDFCFRVMKKLQKNNFFTSCKKVHLIAPSVWAYRENRAQKIAKIYDLLLAILPFEPPYFEKYGLKTVFIGHPLINDKPDFSKKEFIKLEISKTYQISANNKIFLLTPGSRISEVNKIFPVFIETMNRLKSNYPDLIVFIPVVKKTKELIEKLAKNLQVKYFLIEDNLLKKNIFMSVDFALAKSGTNSIEISLHRIPLIIAYKINLISYFIVKNLVKIKFANLLNLLQNREIIPEFLQFDCKADKIYPKILELLSHQNLIDEQINQAQQSFEMLGLNKIENPMQNAFNEILKL